MTSSDKVWVDEAAQFPETEASRAHEAVARGEVLGVLTGQVPVPKSMPIAGCPYCLGPKRCRIHGDDDDESDA